MTTATGAATLENDACMQAWQYEFIIPGVPIPYTRMTYAQVKALRIPAHRRSVALPRRIETYLAYKEYVGLLARAACPEPFTGPVILSIEVYLLDRMKRRWDADNALKGISDALNGIAFLDDKQVTKAQIEIRSLNALDAPQEPEVRVWVSACT